MYLLNNYSTYFGPLINLKREPSEVSRVEFFDTLHKYYIYYTYIHKIHVAGATRVYIKKFD